jgi:hypothetical protein
MNMSVLLFPACISLKEGRFGSIGELMALSKKIDADEQFIAKLDRVTIACYFVTVWILIESVIMYGLGENATYIISEFHYTASQAFETVTPAAVGVGIIGVLISLIFGNACYRAGKRRSNELRNLGIVWLVAPIILALLMPLSLSTMFSGILLYPHDWITSAFSSVQPFFNWIMNGISLTPSFPITMLSYVIKLLALVALMVTSYKIGHKTGIEFLRDATLIVGLATLAGLAGILAFFFFGAGLGRIKIEGMDVYSEPKRKESLATQTGIC